MSTQLTDQNFHSALPFPLLNYAETFRVKPRHNTSFTPEPDLMSQTLSMKYCGILPVDNYYTAT